MSGHLATKVAKAKSRAGGQLCDFLSGTDANTYADKSMNIFPQGRICTDCCIRMLRKLGSWGGDQVVPVFERKGCDNKETVFETVADVITEHVKQWIFVSKKYYQR